MPVQQDFSVLGRELARQIPSLHFAPHEFFKGQRLSGDLFDALILWQQRGVVFNEHGDVAGFQADDGDILRGIRREDVQGFQRFLAGEGQVAFGESGTSEIVFLWDDNVVSAGFEDVEGG